jgi:hypothetical protein
MAGCEGDEPDADPVLEYLARTAAAMTTGYVADCVTHACVLADVLLRSHHSPWIARLNLTTRTSAGIFHVPLMPKRFTGAQAVTWNTHYVCCADGAAYDPMLSRPIPIEHYVREVFGIEAALEEYLSAETTAALSRDGTLRQAFRPKVPSPARPATP